MNFLERFGKTKCCRHPVGRSEAFDCSRRTGRQVTRKAKGESGVALVITLILLAVITFLAVAFLALTRRETSSMSAARRQTDAKLAADTALARVQSEILARMIAQNNFLSYDLQVSRNYTTNGFNSGSTNLDNVSYVYADGQPLSANDQIQNIANLFYDPRVPVYVQTNADGLRDFRFYLDFNRNRRFDTNGLLPVLLDNGSFLIGTNGRAVSNFFVGDPEWVGILQKPEYPHSATNRFIARYAYIVVPEGRALDINFIHNYAKGTTNSATFPANMPADGFLRNQGVGSWEINLAALLKDWNQYAYTNYVYNTNIADNTGEAFSNALQILRYRYATNHDLPTLTVPGLKSAGQTLGIAAIDAFTNDFVDGYANGPLLTTTSNFVADPDDATKPWPGSRNPNMFNDIQELLDPAKTSQDFTNRLLSSGTRTNSNDRYSFYNLLSLLDVHSDTNNTFIGNGVTYKKVHLNYDNFTPNVDGFISQTNFFEWTPSNFFFHAADALIKRSLFNIGANQYLVTTNYVASPSAFVGTNFSLTNIMVYPTNQYTPALHRLLQLAANIYGASTNGFLTNGTANATNLPYVFRPLFRQDGTNIFIVGYAEETTNNIGPFYDLKEFANSTTNTTTATTNFYGIPWIVSVKKGLPNFNEVAMNTGLQLTRKLEFRKASADDATPNETNVMYLATITNFVGMEFWNSYMQAYPRPVRVICTNYVSYVMTNDLGVVLRSNPPNTIVFSTNNVFLFEGAVTNGDLNPRSMLTFTNPISILFDDTQYTFKRDFYGSKQSVDYFFYTNTYIYQFERLAKADAFHTPNWVLTVSNRFFAVVEDEKSGRVIDFVSFNGPNILIDFNKELFGREAAQLLPGDQSSPGVPTIMDLWRTNRVPSGSSGNSRMTTGIRDQIRVSIGEWPPSQVSSLWNGYNSPRNGDYRPSTAIISQMARFRDFMMGPSTGEFAKTNRLQAPFNPTISITFKTAWQANDPLVHYIPADLLPPEQLETPRVMSRSVYATNIVGSNLKKLNDQYRPWGGRRNPTQSPMDAEGKDESAYDLSIKDPMVRWSDDWNFPTNKFPNVGWLGRVHRGTPWQTVYLKSAVAGTNAWDKWTPSRETYPTNDWYLLDVFTVAPNDNAARGLLSVNQTNLAAWSAVLSGVLTLSNTVNNPREGTIPTYDAVVIEPTSAQLSNIVTSINSARTNRPGLLFQSMGEVLSADALTINSPFLNLTNGVAADLKNYSIDDNAYERIPQQVLSLLKSDQPRMVVYAYGQSLKPAENSIIVNGPLRNLCTNYQVMGESIVRAALRIEQKIDPIANRTNYHAVIESYQIVPQE